MNCRMARSARSSWRSACVSKTRLRLPVDLGDVRRAAATSAAASALLVAHELRSAAPRCASAGPPCLLDQSPGSGSLASVQCARGPDKGHHSPTQHAASRRRRIVSRSHDLAETRGTWSIASPSDSTPTSVRSTWRSRSAQLTLRATQDSRRSPSTACTSPSRGFGRARRGDRFAARGRARPAAPQLQVLSGDWRGSLRVADGRAARRARRHDRRARRANGEPAPFSAADVELLRPRPMLAPVVLNARLLDLVAGPDSERAGFVDEMARAGVPVVDDARIATTTTSRYAASASTGIAIRSGPSARRSTRSGARRVHTVGRSAEGTRRPDARARRRAPRPRRGDSGRRRELGPSSRASSTPTCRSSRTTAS